MKEIEVKDLIKYINPLKTSYCDGNETNGLTIGWVGFGVLWRKPMATVYVHKTRYSKHIFDQAKYYSICFMDQEHKIN